MRARKIHGFAAGVWLACWAGATGPAAARSDAPVPPDLLDVRTYPGGRGILELDGTNVHNVGNIWLHVTNFGLLGSQPGTYRPWGGAPSAQWPAGSTTEYLWSAGLWIGAMKNDEAHVTTGQPEFEFRPGLEDVDRIYRSREGLAGGARAPAVNADDDRDGRTDEDWADGRDNDGDGRIDEDFAAISSQMFTCEYRDDHPNIALANPEHRPLGVKVLQTSMVWEDPTVDDFVAFDFKIVNEGFETIRDVYLGVYADGDIGPRGEHDTSTDDMAGFWEGIVHTRVGNTPRSAKVSIGYMWDEDLDEGRSEGYMGLMFLGQGRPEVRRGWQPLSLRNFRSFAGKGAFEFGGDPGNDTERYKSLDGTARFSLPAADPRTGLRPALRTGTQNDYRFIVSAGPFGGIGPGDTLAVQAALVIGRYFEGLKEAAAQAVLTLEGAWADCDHDPNTGVDGREQAACAPEYSGRWFLVGGPGELTREILLGIVEPCDTLCIFPRDRQALRCVARVPDEIGCVWYDEDCDRSTGVNGQECVVRWFVGLPPPPPRMRLVARERQVDVLFDDTSERIPDQRLQVQDFEAYRIWRADDWTRPTGSGVETGPPPESWTLLAEFDLPNNLGRDTGMSAIRYAPAIPQYAVEFYREWYLAHPYLQPPVLPGLTEAQVDTAVALGRGVKYYRYVDPPFVAPPSNSDPPCGPEGRCDPVRAGNQLVHRRCDERGRCRQTAAPPHTGAHYFYSVTATDHRVEMRNGQPVAVGEGLQGDPQSNYVFVDPPSDALQPERWEEAGREIYVVPNPATRESLSPWTLDPNNQDPSGTKVEFHHLPAERGEITIFTISGDMVDRIAFDGRSGNGTAKWDLVNRNGQDVTSGVYLFTVEAPGSGFARFTGRFVVVR